MEAIGSQSVISFSCNLCKEKVFGNGISRSLEVTSRSRRSEITCKGMLAPRKFMQRKKMEVFKDAADEADQRNWRKLMTAIEESGSAVSVLKAQRDKHAALPRDLVLGTLIRFKQLKKWNLVSEILEWLKCQNWWDFTQMDFLMLITSYGKLGDFSSAEKVFKSLSKKGIPPSVISHTALMEAYARAGKYNQAEAIFRRMQLTGPEPSPLTYQIIMKSFVEANKFKEAEEVFQGLLNEERAPFKPDQKMFHLMIYMFKKAKNYEEARKTFALMAKREIPQSAVTFNSLMSFETDYKEVSKIYDQMQRSGIKPDVVSYALLINAYGKARREDEALAVFEEMLDAGVRPTRKAFNILLNAFARCGLVNEARTVFKSMRRDKCTPDFCSYATMLLAYVNASDMDGAENFFRRLKNDGFEPNVVAYGTLMKGYAKSDDLEKVMEVYERMQMQGVEVNQTILTTIMDIHGRISGFGGAVAWFREFAVRGLVPDQKAKNILLSMAKTHDEKSEALELAGVLGAFPEPTTVLRKSSEFLADEAYDDLLSSPEAVEASDNDTKQAVLGMFSSFDDVGDEDDEDRDFAPEEDQPFLSKVLLK